MSLELLDMVPLWGIFVASMVITFLSTELGFRVGRRRRERLAGEREIHAGPLVAATLSLLAFMLAMVFNAVESRFSELKHVVLDEANAIETAVLRADLLPEADRDEVRQLLHDYVALRVDAGRSGQREQIERAIERSEELQSVLWSRAAAFAAQQPTPTSALFVQSVNDLIDLHETRITLSIRYRLPGTIWGVLIGLAILAMGMGGYATGLSDDQRLIAIALSAALAFSVVLTLVVSIDRPHDRTLAVNQAAMMGL